MHQPPAAGEFNRIHSGLPSLPVPPARWWGPLDKHREVPSQFCKENTRGHWMVSADKIESFYIQKIPVVTQPRL